MKKVLSIFHITSIILILAGCSNIPFFSTSPVTYSAVDNKIEYFGRIDYSIPGIARISSAGAYMRFQFKGDFCELILSDQNLYNGHSYISVEIDGMYKERIKIHKDQKIYSIVDGLEDINHEVLICKATEPANGFIDVEGIVCPELLLPTTVNKKQIEFIGNSITCGMGNDITGLPCGQGQWYDQHNAYWSYAPIAARALNAEWLLSSVSGIGLYRNWNSEAPVMPQVYDNLYLNTDSSKQWDPGSFKADLISICLGTNDFSNGDGSYDRTPIDSSKYVNAYVGFVKHLRSINNDAQIVCLTSPMMAGGLSARLKSFIEEVIIQIKGIGDNKIHLFEFSGSFNSGCSGHPDIEEQKLIAAQLIPFYKKVMNW
jgi:hypothetical protein